MKAKKSLGQHFLKSERALRQIVEAGNITPDDIVLEIGPGQGVLTERLIARAKKVIAIEKDRELIPILEEKFAGEIAAGKLEIIEQDILKFDPAVRQDLTGKRGYKLVANIPYYITGAIIEQFLSTTHQPSLMVLLMQKEVADRIIARDHKESILSIAIKAYGTPRIIDKVPPGAFAPAPTVDSSILLISMISRDFFKDLSSTTPGYDEKLFLSVMKAVFGRKRKQIGGSLAEYLDNKDRAIATLERASIDPRTRPEDLTLADWKNLAQSLES